MSKPKERSEFVDDFRDWLEGGKRRKVERREREAARATEEMEVTLRDGRTVRCGRSV